MSFTVKKAARRALSLSVYVITDPDLSRGRTPEEVCARAIEGGADVVQLRDKGAFSRRLYEAALRMRELTRKAGVLFIVNDRVDIALAADADGVHLGTDDFPVSEARRLLEPGKIIGASASTPEEARRAEAEGADYLGVGAMFEARTTKADAGAPIGPGAISTIKKHTNLPIVGVGGIKHSNAAEVISAGADGVAVISAVVTADDIAAAVRELKRIVLKAKGTLLRPAHPSTGST